MKLEIFIGDYSLLPFATMGISNGRANAFLVAIMFSRKDVLNHFMKWM